MERYGDTGQTPNSTQDAAGQKPGCELRRRDNKIRGYPGRVKWVLRTKWMKMASIQLDEVSEYGGLMTAVRKKHLAVSKGRQEVSGAYMALIGWTDTPGKRHTWLNLALEGQQNPF